MKNAITVRKDVIATVARRIVILVKAHSPLPLGHSNMTRLTCSMVILWISASSRGVEMLSSYEDMICSYSVVFM